MTTVIIGAGPAGRLAASELGRNNEEVILIEKKHIAGTCLNEGCMVICALNDIAKLLNAAERFENLDLIKSNITISYQQITEKIKETQEKLRNIEEAENKSLGNKIIYGEAKIQKENNKLTVEVNNEKYTPEKILIATGSRPYLPNIPGIENAITSKDILNLKNTPKKLNIIGGGMIAIELANIFSSFGSEVHILARNTILKDLDEDLREFTIKHLLKKVNIHENTTVTKITQNKTITTEKEFGGTTLIATGRIPNSEIVKNIVELNSDNSIKVDKTMKTSNQNIYAAGDVTGGIQLTPVARREGIIASRNIMGIHSEINYNNIPESLTLDMDVSFIKNTKKEEATREIKQPGGAGPEVFWKLLNDKTGITKIKFNKKDEIVDAYAISPSGVGDTAYIAFLMNMGITKEDFDKFLELHPSTDTYYKILKFLN